MGKVCADLIDTQWNVNTDGALCPACREMDLIDTQWNVNHDILRLALISSLRFNRYIVECKLQNIIGVSITDVDLIDTQWNVNKLASITGQDWSRFNRYIVECKFCMNTINERIHYRFNRYIVECKYFLQLIQGIHVCDLIDTQWNVNTVIGTIIATWGIDLIDTQWNVNLSSC